MDNLAALQRQGMIGGMALWMACLLYTSVKSMFFMVQTRCEVGTIKY